MFKSIWLISTISVIGLFIPVFAGAQAFQFSRSLYVGVNSVEVYALQVILNRNSATRVALSGAGSPGQETFYFGSRTKIAVMKFQKLYGIQSVGVVGPLTRVLLNALGLVPTPVPATTSSVTQASSVSTPAPVPKSPFIASMAPQRGSYDSVITLTGSGFTSTGNTVHTGFDTLTLPSPDGKTIQIPINSPGLPKYTGSRTDLVWDLWIFVENQNGESNIKIFNFIPKL